jgi:hypothetical protein
MYERFYMLCCSPAVGSWLCILQFFFKFPINLPTYKCHNWSGRSVWDQQSNFGRPLFFVFSFHAVTILQEGVVLGSPPPPTMQFLGGNGGYFEKLS